MIDAKERYRSDPLFARVVDSLRLLLREHQMTPSELREALMLAAYCEEVENPSPVFYRVDNLRRILKEDVTGHLMPSTVCRRCKTAGHVAQRDSTEPDRPAGHNCRVAIGQEVGPFSPPRINVLKQRDEDFDGTSVP